MSSEKEKEDTDDPRQGACKFCGTVTARKERHERRCDRNPLKSVTSTPPRPSQTVECTAARHEATVVDDFMSEVNLVKYKLIPILIEFTLVKLSDETLCLNQISFYLFSIHYIN